MKNDANPRNDASSTEAKPRIDDNETEVSQRGDPVSMCCRNLAIENNLPEISAIREPNRTIRCSGTASAPGSFARPRSFAMTRQSSNLALVILMNRRRMIRQSANLVLAIRMNRLRMIRQSANNVLVILMNRRRMIRLSANIVLVVLMHRQWMIRQGFHFGDRLRCMLARISLSKICQRSLRTSHRVAVVSFSSNPTNLPEGQSMSEAFREPNRTIRCSGPASAPGSFALPRTAWPGALAALTNRQQYSNVNDYDYKKANIADSELHARATTRSRQTRLEGQPFLANTISPITVESNMSTR